MAPFYTILGLGNPGDKYSFTRHNAGFLLVDVLSRRHRGRWGKDEDGCLLCPLEIGTKELLLVKPLSYVNRTGVVAEALRDRGLLTIRNLLAVCDDFNLPLGRLRLRFKGGDGGHNGLKSIIEHLSSDEFGRLRLGVGPLPAGIEPADFVLAEFTSEEEVVFQRVLASGADCIEELVTAGLEAAMSKFNGMDLAED